ncbi:hypothetical protein GCM10020000_76210 [Streptomyces olivoverticillatus]
MLAVFRSGSTTGKKLTPNSMVTPSAGPLRTIGKRGTSEFPFALANGTIAVGGRPLPQCHEPDPRGIPTALKRFWGAGRPEGESDGGYEASESIIPAFSS